MNGEPVEKHLPLILVVVSTNALSQLLLKQGMINIGRFDFAGASLIKMAPSIALNPFVIVGLMVMVASMALHLLVLSRVELSFAYPFLSISYVIVLFLGALWFGEMINASRLLGVALICLGTFFVGRS